MRITLMLMTGLFSLASLLVGAGLEVSPYESGKLSVVLMTTGGFVFLIALAAWIFVAFGASNGRAVGSERIGPAAISIRGGRDNIADENLIVGYERAIDIQDSPGTRASRNMSARTVAELPQELLATLIARLRIRND